MRPSVAKQEQNYQGSVPRCSLCVHFKEARIVLTTNSNTVRVNSLCMLGGFNVTPNGCCDVWKGKDGSVLEADPLAPVAQEHKFACAVCGRKFTTQAAARQHTKDAHK